MEDFPNLINCKISDDWVKNEKIKTCKCEMCGIHVKYWSYKCRICGRHICSECLRPGSNRPRWAKVKAFDHLTGGCWHRFRSNFNPAFIKHPANPIRPRQGANPQTGPPVTPANNIQSTRAEQAPPVAGPSKSFVMSDGSIGSWKEALLSLEDDEAAYRPEAGNEDARSLAPPKTKPRPYRAGSKRQSYVEEASDDDVFMRRTPEAKKRKTMNVVMRKPWADSGSAGAPIQNSDTVIVGAGVVGLFIALELATHANRSKSDHRITVIEARSGPCELASGHCAGFLSTSGIPQDWEPIMSDAFERWHDLFGSAGFREQVRFDTNTHVKVKPGKQRLDQAPSWLKNDIGLKLAEDIDSIGRIDSKSLSTWLLQSCISLGVRFRFGQSVSRVVSETGGKLSGIDVRLVGDEDTAPARLPCNNIILAAGPFTKGIFTELFPNTTLQLNSHVHGSDWFAVDSSAVASEFNAALRFSSAAEEEDRLNNEIVMESKGDRILISGFAAHVRRHIDPDLVLKPSKGKISELRTVAAKYLSREIAKAGHREGILDRGRWELGVANRGRPIIDRVPASALGIDFQDPMQDWQPNGVWLCYGFGQYGTTLAPNAARLLRKKMSGVTGISTSIGDVFDIPEYPRHQTKGKGKAKAD